MSLEKTSLMIPKKGLISDRDEKLDTVGIQTILSYFDPK